MNYWYGDNPNCGRCGHLNGLGHCNMTACIYPVIETTTIVTPEIKPRTNYDLIISKTPEALADFLWGIGNNPATGNYYLNGKLLFSCADGNGWLVWLKQEAE